MAILKGVKDRIDVKVTAVVETDNGKDINVPFVVTYKKCTVPETVEIEEKLKTQLDAAGNVTAEPLSDPDLVKMLVLGWSQVPTQTGEEYEFSDEHLAEMLDTREYLVALVTGAKQVLWGREAVLAKNSMRPGLRGR
jgi:hypothetical protein